MVGDVGSKYTPTNSVKLYARWTDKYTITYKANGGEINATSDKVKIGESISLRTPTRTGYVFEGWYSSSDFSGSPIVPNNYTPSSNVTLFAKWRELTATEMMDNFEQCKTRRQQTSCTENMNHCHGRLNQFTSNPKIHGKI